MAFSWDVSSPADDAVVSQFPSNERAARAAARGAVNAEHYADTTGYHRQLTLPDLAGDYAGVADAWSLWDNNDKLNARLGTGTVVRVITLLAGTKQLWPQAAPPTGWTLDTDQDDVLIRVDSAAGGTTGGTWTISGLSADSHTHGPGSLGFNNSACSPPNLGTNQGGASVTAASTAHTHSATLNLGNSATASATGVTSTGAWRPAYLDVCKATLD